VSSGPSELAAQALDLAARVAEALFNEDADRSPAGPSGPSDAEGDRLYDWQIDSLLAYGLKYHGMEGHEIETAIRSSRRKRGAPEKCDRTIVAMVEEALAGVETNWEALMTIAALEREAEEIDAADYSLRRGSLPERTFNLCEELNEHHAFVWKGQGVIADWRGERIELRSTRGFELTYALPLVETGQWIVLGGASRYSKTPEWRPPVEWWAPLHAEAREKGIRVYHKTNLYAPVVEYPWQPREETKLPEAFNYLGSKKREEVERGEVGNEAGVDSGR
jgi:hypothetical protein